MLKIALLGFPDSARTELALTLAAALHAAGSPAVVTSVDALTQQTNFSKYDLVLLMGLVSAGTAPPAPALDAADQHIRTTLNQGGVAYQVIYGRGNERLQHALQACEDLRAHSAPPVESGTIAAMAAMAGVKKPRAWTWMCDKCSDPVCEHRLLSDLLASRSAKG